MQRIIPPVLSYLSPCGLLNLRRQNPSPPSSVQRAKRNEQTHQGSTPPSNLPPIALLTSRLQPLLELSQERKTEEIVDLQVGERHEARGTVWRSHGSPPWSPNPLSCLGSSARGLLSLLHCVGSSIWIHSKLCLSVSLLPCRSCSFRSPHGRKDRGLMYLR